VGFFDDLLEGATVIVWDSSFRLAATAHLKHPAVAMVEVAAHPRRTDSGNAAGLRLAIAGTGGVGLWTVADGELRLSQRVSVAASVTALALVADLGGLGAALALGCADGSLKYWGLAKGELLQCSGRVGGGEVLCVATRPTQAGGTRVVATAADGSIAAWDVGEGGASARAGMPLRLGGPCGSLALGSRDVALVGCADGAVYIAQLAGAAEDRLLRVCGGHYGCPLGARFALGERLVASAGGDDGTIRVFDTELNRQILALATGGVCLGIATVGVMSALPSEPSLLVAGCYGSGHVRVFDLLGVTMELKAHVFAEPDSAATAVEFLSPCLAVVGSADGRLSALHFQRGASKEARTEPIAAGSGPGVSSLSVSAGRSKGTFCAVHSGWGGRVAVYDTAPSGSCPVLRCEVPVAGELLAACLAPWDHGNTLVVASGMAVSSEQAVQSEPAAVAAGHQSRLDFVSLRSSRAVVSIVLDWRVECVAASTGPRPLVAVGTMAGTLLLLDRCGALVAQGSGHSGPVAAVEVGSVLVSTSPGELIVWNLPEETEA
jgi:WD40 repeat protein